MSRGSLRTGARRRACAPGGACGSGGCARSRPRRRRARWAAPRLSMTIENTPSPNLSHMFCIASFSVGQLVMTLCSVAGTDAATGRPPFRANCP